MLEPQELFDQYTACDISVPKLTLGILQLMTGGSQPHSPERA